MISRLSPTGHVFLGPLVAVQASHDNPPEGVVGAPVAAPGWADETPPEGGPDVISFRHRTPPWPAEERLPLSVQLVDRRTNGSGGTPGLRSALPWAGQGRRAESGG